MAKTLNEELFDRLMRLTHQMRNMRHEHECDGHHEKHNHGRHHEHNDKTERSFMRIRERVLGVLTKKDSGMHQKEIAEEIRVNPSSMSELVDKLESDGYVIRTADPSDKRATLIVLTEKGQARAYEIEDSREEQLALMFSNFTEDEKRDLIRLLDKFTGEHGKDNREFHSTGRR